MTETDRAARSSSQVTLMDCSEKVALAHCQARVAFLQSIANEQCRLGDQVSTFSWFQTSTGSTRPYIHEHPKQRRKCQDASAAVIVAATKCMSLRSMATDGKDCGDAFES